jgi:prepilin-type N-terminal cleavage/methylation domain-containing protein
MPGIRYTKLSGFTLVEAMVSVAIFAILMVSATDIFLSIVRSQRNTLSSKNAQEAVNYALEIMSKELRMAKVDNGYCGAAQKVYAVFDENGQLVESGDGLTIKFRNYEDKCVVYELDNPSGRLKVTRDGSWAYMTPANITISNLSFYIQHSDIQIGQPIITVRFILSYFNSETGQQTMQVQTSISSRSYENYEFGG